MGKESSCGDSFRKDDAQEAALGWDSLQRLPTYQRARIALLHGVTGDLKEIDLQKLDVQETKELLNRVVRNPEDNEEYLLKLKNRIDRVSLCLPTIEVRFQNLNISGEAYLGERASPSLFNYFLNIAESVAKWLHLCSNRKQKFSILCDASGIIKPGRMTLLLGPPGSGKTTLLKALSGKFDSQLQFSGRVTYNGHEMKEFVPQRTAAYISQYDIHLPLMTVRETLMFSARCQGIGTTYDMLIELLRKEKEMNIKPDPYIDALMKASVLKGQKEDIVTEYILKVTSRKDQGQYWSGHDDQYRYISADEFVEGFKSFRIGRAFQHELAIPFQKSNSHPAALIRTTYGATRKELMKACLSREFTLMKRSASLHIFKSIQLEISALVVATVFAQARKHHDSIDDGVVFLGALYFGLNSITFTGFYELPMTIEKLPVFYKQRDLHFYPSWAFSLPASIFGIPTSFIEVAFWVAITYFIIGFDPSFTRVIKQFLVYTLSGQMSYALFRCLGAVTRDTVVANTGGCLGVLWLLIFGGFILSHDNMQKWLSWGYWTSPLMYAQTALSTNEFLSKSWARVPEGSTESLGILVLKSRGLFVKPYWYWISVAALFGFIVFFNGASALFLASLNEYGKSQTVYPHQKTEKKKNLEMVRVEKGHVTEETNTSFIRSKTDNSPTNSRVDRQNSQRMLLPFTPLYLTFENVKYSVDVPKEMKAQGASGGRLDILKGVSGAFRPGVLTALMGISGAGKTTLLDVLAGRKNSGYIEGSIRISGFPKKQETFAQISGYCEQNDIHSPYLTVYESLIFSAWLRLPSEVDSKTLELFLLTRGGEEIYVGPLGQRSCHLIKYFEDIPGVDSIRDGYNPATWVLDMTTAAKEEALGIKFADVYKKSDLFRQNEALIRELSAPPPDAQALHFPSKYPRSYLTQFKACLWKQHKSFFRNTSYNAVRMLFSASMGLLFGAVFLRLGSKSINKVAIEFPYTLVQVALYAVIVYAMMGYEWTASKFLLNYFFMFITILYFIYYGMVVVAVSPNQATASMLTGFSYSVWNLFTGFVIPRTRISVWWRWYAWICPVSWSLYGTVTSQFADIQTKLDTGETVAEFIEQYYGYKYDFLWVVSVALLVFTLLMVLVFVYATKHFNFQKR
ncbi:ABC transporter G family member 39, partial [Cucurbita argyrosperma subsp. argyrosperma]